MLELPLSNERRNKPMEEIAYARDLCYGYPISRFFFTVITCLSFTYPCLDSSFTSTLDSFSSPAPLTYFFVKKEKDNNNVEKSSRKEMLFAKRNERFQMHQTGISFVIIDFMPLDLFRCLFGDWKSIPTACHGCLLWTSLPKNSLSHVPASQKNRIFNMQ